MGAQFSEEFLLGYRAGHRDGFADAVRLMRDAATSLHQGVAVALREQQLSHLLSGGGLVPAKEAIPEESKRQPAVDLLRRSQRLAGWSTSHTPTASTFDTPARSPSAP